MSVEVRPIQEPDLPRVAAYLSENHRSRFTADEWLRSGIASPWNPETPPNRGFMLVDNGEIAGVIVSMYSTRLVDGREVQLCNLSSWHVLPDYRFHSFKLLRAALSQEGMLFTDLTPTEEVQRMNLRLGFRYVETSTALVPNLPWPPWPSGVEIVADPDEIERRLPAPLLRIYHDHRHAIPARHVVLSRADRVCYVVFRRERRKKMPVFGAVLYVSDPDAFMTMARPFLRHLLVRHGIAATLIDDFIVDYRPFGSVSVQRHRPKMVRLGDVEPEKVDALYLYSDLPAIPP